MVAPNFPSSENLPRKLKPLPEHYHQTYRIEEDFSGWYAISSSDKCNDYCFWETLIPTDGDLKGHITTADPHRTTSLPISNWRCALDAAEGKFKLTPLGYFGPTLEHLRCAGGEGEVLVNRGSKIVSSTNFWSALLVIAVVCLSLELGACGRILKGCKRNEGITTDNKNEGTQCAMGKQNGSTTNNPVDSNPDTEDETNKSDTLCQDKAQEAGEEITATSMANNPVDDNFDIAEDENKSDMLCQEEIQEVVEVSAALGVTTSEPDSKTAIPSIGSKQLSLKSINAKVLCLVTGTIISLSALLLSVFSLYDLEGGHLFGFVAMLTPSCSDLKDICNAGNHDLNRPSRSYPRNNNNINDAFSYLITSDSQMYWYSGEHSGLGGSSIPFPCTESDTCSECTDKFGEYTNRQMKKSFEEIISNSNESLRTNTFIMNGDLTSAFHPGERKAYENIFHNIKGVENYFPGLGNHDYVHHFSAKYNSDQWFGPGSCNANHAIGYIRGGFCGRIPGFDPNRITRYDAASLAYSWEEGRYHFVQLHHRPAWESQLVEVRSSISWLERDLTLAHEQNLMSVIFLHDIKGFPHVAENIIAGKNVKAVFVGHNHRCLMRKCAIPWALTNEDVSYNSSKIIDKCIPGSMGKCSPKAYDRSPVDLFFLNNVTDDRTIQDIHKRSNSLSLRASSSKIFINQTDNTMFCQKIHFRPELWLSFPENNETNSTIIEYVPIFWSGSSSFETFLKVDFYSDRFVVNAMTAEAGKEGMRYIDTHDVPNAVYPYHDKSDLEEVVIIL